MDYNKIIDLYKEGYSGIKIAEILNLKSRTVYRLIKKSGITRSNSINSRKYYVDHNFFETIDTEEKAYWLGFLMADGSVSEKTNKISLALHTSDKGHIEKFLKDLKSNYKIKDYLNNFNSPYSRVIISSSKIKEDLIRLGCVPNKSGVLKFPVLNNDLKSHFIRGYFDGDGSISISGKQFKFRVCGTYEFLKEILINIGFKNKLLKRWPLRNNNNYDIDIGGNIQVLSICNYLYENSTLFLDRKFERYKLLRSLYQETDK